MPEVFHEDAYSVHYQLVLSGCDALQPHTILSAATRVSTELRSFAHLFLVTDSPSVISFVARSAGALSNRDDIDALARQIEHRAKTFGGFFDGSIKFRGGSDVTAGEAQRLYRYVMGDIDPTPQSSGAGREPRPFIDLMLMPGVGKYTRGGL